MTLILGMVCDDGVVIAADSKMTNSQHLNPTYTKKKIQRVDRFAIAFAGRGYMDNAFKVITQAVRGLIELNPNIPLDIVAKEICNRSLKILYEPEDTFGILVSDGYGMYHIRSIHSEGALLEAKSVAVADVMLGIADVKFLPYKGGDTTKEWGEYFRKVIKLNKGLSVGGRTQVVILKPRQRNSSKNAIY